LHSDEINLPKPFAASAGCRIPATPVTVEGPMPTDLDEAHHIVARHESLFGKLDPSLENIGRLIAEGIALGRRQGLELAASLIADEIGRIPVGDKV